MTLDKVIEKLIEAKEHCVPGNTKVNVWFTDNTSLTVADKFEGSVCNIDYDNKGVNIYFDNL